ncbi:hypothetical protein NUM3379_09730 [Kineococcus sp. NUM-3379]
MGTGRSEDGGDRELLAMSLLVVAWLLLPSYLMLESITATVLPEPPGSAARADDFAWWSIVLGVGLPVTGAAIGRLHRVGWTVCFSLAAAVYLGWAALFAVSAHGIPAPPWRGPST